MVCITHDWVTIKQNISLHVRNIYREGELAPEATVKKYLTVLKYLESERKRWNKAKVLAEHLKNTWEALNK